MISCIDLGPERFAVLVQARLIGIDSFSAILLSMSLFATENARHIVPV
jgi:hypothetical protein